MSRTHKHLRSIAGTSHTKARVCFGCAQMRPVSIQQWNNKTGLGLPA
jgi:hypothetical protein